jgi:hypothetical protein
LLPADPDARFAFGADARYQVLQVSRPDADDTFSFEVTEANLYGEGRLVPGRVSLYLDAKTAPGGAVAREVFALFSARKRGAYLKVGKFLPPFGWRLPDDQAYIRQFTGFTYSAPDTGIEVGLEPGRWSFHLAAVNGTSGGAEADRSKQFSLLGVRRFGGSRVGLSASNNIVAGVRTTQAGLLGSLGLGRLALLAEGSLARRRDSAGGEREISESLVAFIEADLLIVRGLSLRLAHDYLDPSRDVSTDARTRDSLGVEYVPYPFVQLRLHVRNSDGPPQFLGTRDRQADFEIHVFF